MTVVPLPDGAHTAGLAVGAGAVWGANGRAGTVVRLDPRTNQVVATIPVAAPSPGCDRCWGAVAARGDVVWAAMDTAGPVVARIDPASNAIAERVAVGVLPSALAVDEDGALWLTAVLENAIVHVDPYLASATARTAVHLPAGIIAGRDTVWVTAGKPGANGEVVRIDPRTGVVLTTISVGRDPVGVEIGADEVWVVSRGSALVSPPTLSRIDPGSNTVMETTPIDGTAPIDTAAGAGSLWIASGNLDEVMRIGPVSLPDSAPAAGAQPRFPLALGAGAMLVLAAGKARRQSARPGRDPTVPAGHLLKTLLLRQQASRRAVGRSVLHGRLSACPTPGVRGSQR